MSNQSQNNPLEFSVRGIVLGIFITLIFTAAQVYLGLKVGLTFATSIPAAVISMALLSAFKDATIQENNIVQTIASAAGTLASVIFVLPGLLMIGWWAKIPFWPTFGACAIGGVLGVMYTMPLRRALVSQSDLPYPEGVAAAEVLKVGTQSRAGAQEGKAGLWAVIWGSVASAVFAFLGAAKLVAAEVAHFVKFGNGATGLGASSSLALVGAGHLMGIAVGMAMLLGLVIAWGILVPLLTMANPAAPGVSLADHALGIWSSQVRMMGAGTIGAAAIVTLATLAKPVVGGLKSAMESARSAKAGGADVPREDKDLPLFVVGLVTLLSMVPAGWLLSSFLSGGPLSSISTPLVVVGVGYILIAGMLAAAVCGYMAGLIGSSNSPVSGLAILSILGAATSVGWVGREIMGPDTAQALIAFALFVTTVVLAVAVIGNDNLQDLKTGQLVGATPWKQQIALIIGVFAGSCVVPPVLELLNHANGFCRRTECKRNFRPAVGRAASDPDFHAGKRRDRRRPALGPDRLWRPDRPGAGGARLHPEEIEQAQIQLRTAGRWPGNLPAVGGDVAGGGGRDRRLLVRAGNARQEAWRGGFPPWRAGHVRIHRGRELVQRCPGWTDRADQQGRTAGNRQQHERSDHHADRRRGGCCGSRGSVPLVREVGQRH